jgi:COMPASS component SWD3
MELITNDDNMMEPEKPNLIENKPVKNNTRVIKYSIDYDKDLGAPECLVLKYEYLNGNIAAGYSDGSLIIHKLSNSTYKHLSYSYASITSLRWKPHNQTVSKNVLLSIDSEGRIIYWHTTTGKILHRIEEQGVSLLCLDYNRDGSLFAIGSDDRTIRIYDENMKTVVCRVSKGNSFQKGHTGRINSVCFKKDDTNVLVSGGWDGKVLLHDLREDVSQVNTKEIIVGPYVNGDCIDIKGDKLLIGDKKTMKLYDLRTLNMLESLDTDSTIYTAQFNKSNSSFAFGGSSNNLLHVLKYTNGEIKPILTKNALFKPIYTLDFSYDGNFLAYSGADPAINIITL